MMQKDKLRRSDFITSLILILFSIWELSETFKMPMKDSYAGVESTWYVSPALMPLFIGLALMLLSITLLIHSIRTGGAADVINRIKKRDTRDMESPISMILILTALGSFVYLSIPRIDFYLAILNFLLFFISIFYFNNEDFKRRYGFRYSIGVVCFALIVLTGLYDMAIGVFKYSFDIIFLLLFLTQLFYCRHWAGKLNMERPFRISTIVTLTTPTILVPVFRYFLLVQLPHEGGIIKLLNLVYYNLR